MSEDEIEFEAEEEIESPEEEGKNYITPSGLERLKAELKSLRDTERPEVVKTVAWAASNGDRSENADYIYGKRRLREIDRRLGFLTRRLDKAFVVDPTQLSGKKVMFGATVKIRNEREQERTYSIVGADEVDLTRGRISWLSPMAKALLKAEEGDTIEVTTPKGEEEVEVLKVSYIKLD